MMSIASNIDPTYYISMEIIYDQIDPINYDFNYHLIELNYKTTYTTCIFRSKIYNNGMVQYVSL